MAKYQRVIRKADPFDFLNTLRDDKYEIDKPSTLDKDEETELLVNDKEKETVKLTEIDPIDLATIVQNIFFDLYGQNMPRNKEMEVLEALPIKVPNSLDDFQLLIMQTLRTLKIYEWLAQNEDEDDVVTPQDFNDKIDDLVDSGYYGVSDSEHLNNNFSKSAGSIDNMIHKAEYLRDRMEQESYYGYRNEGNSARSIGSVKSDPRNRVYEGEDGITDAYLNIVQESDPLIAMWDCGISQGHIKKVRSAQDGFSAASGSSSGDSWYGAISNATSFTSQGLPIINCDSMAK